MARKRRLLAAAGAALLILLAAGAALFRSSRAGRRSAAPLVRGIRSRGEVLRVGPAGGGSPRGTAKPWFTETGPEREPAEDEVLAAAVQFASRFGEPGRNRRLLVEMAGRAAERGAKLISLPEAAIPGYASGTGFDRQVWRSPGFKGEERSLEGVAETVPGASTRAFGELSKRHGCYIAVPVIEHDEARDRYYNTAAVVGPAGNVVCHYRKLHPWTIVEYGWAQKGDRGLGVFDTPYGRVGVMICRDVHALMGSFSKQRVAAVLYSVAWVDHHPGTWFGERLPEICGREGVALVLANWSYVGPEFPANGFGYSRIISGEGRVVREAARVHSNEIVYGVLPRSEATRPAPR